MRQSAPLVHACSTVHWLGISGHLRSQIFGGAPPGRFNGCQYLVAESCKAGPQGPAPTAGAQHLTPCLCLPPLLPVLSGATAASFSDFLPGEVVTALAAWDPFLPPSATQQQQPEQQQQQQPQPGGRGDPGAAGAAEEYAGAPWELPRGFEQRMRERGRDAGEGVAARLRAYGLHDMADRAEAIVVEAERRRRRQGELCTARSCALCCAVLRCAARAGPAGR